MRLRARTPFNFSADATSPLHLIDSSSMQGMQAMMASPSHVWRSFVTDAAIASRWATSLVLVCCTALSHRGLTPQPKPKLSLSYNRYDSHAILSCLSSSRYASALSHGETFLVLIQRAHLPVHCPSRTHIHHASSHREPRRVSQPAIVLFPLVSHRRSLRGDPFHNVSMHHTLAQNLVKLHCRWIRVCVRVTLPSER